MSIITAQQSRDARRELGLSQSEVAKALDINRQYLSELETGFSTRLTASQLKKLRTFYEDKIAEANANGENIEIVFGEKASPPLTLPKVENFSAKRITFPVADEIPIEVLAKSLDMISDNEARIATLLDLQAERDDGVFGEGEFTDSAKDNLQEIYALLALNSTIYLSLRGWSALNIPPGAESITSLRDIVFESFKPQLQAAGLIEIDQESEE